jgi:uncharacterized protein
MDSFSITPPWFPWVATAAFAAGLVRGLVGFGGALILVPILSTFLGPVVAVPVLNIVDGLTTLPLVPGAVRRCHWPEVLPLFLGAVVLLPVGVHVLRVADPVTLRHVMSVAILVIVGCMAAGFRYARSPGKVASAGVGALSGLMSGAVGLSGPPIVLFWLGGQTDARTARANLIAYFALSSLAVVVTMLWVGLFTGPVQRLSVALCPLYALGVLLGARGFRYASERVFRGFALSLIAAVALISLFL